LAAATAESVAGSDLVISPVCEGSAACMMDADGSGKAEGAALFKARGPRSSENEKVEVKPPALSEAGDGGGERKCENSAAEQGSAFRCGDEVSAFEVSG